MPGFWKFMWRVSPFTYLLEGLLTTGLAGAPATCSSPELLRLVPPAGQTCGAYLSTYISSAGGYLSDPAALTTFEYCPVDSTNQFLGAIGLDYGNR